MDPASDEVARAGLLRFLADDPLLDEPHGAWPLEVLHRPVRVQLAPGCRIDYGVGPVDGCDLVLPPDIEQCNFGWLDGGTELGWLGPDGLGALRLSDGLGELAVEQWFVEREGRLCLRQPGKLFMITSNPSIALSDCLFYMVKA